MDLRVINRYNLPGRGSDPWECSGSTTRRILQTDNELVIQIGNDTIDFNPKDNITTPTCSEQVQSMIDQACQSARDEQSDCCDIIGDTLCDQFQSTCEFDVCIEVGVIQV